LKLPHSATLRFNRFDKRQRAHVSIAIDLNSPRRKGGVVNRNFEYVSRSEKIGFRTFGNGWPRLRLLRCDGAEQAQKHDD
jgi:hypothetical protein